MANHTYKPYLQVCTKRRKSILNKEHLSREYRTYTKDEPPRIHYLNKLKGLKIKVIPMESKQKDKEHAFDPNQSINHNKNT